MDSNKKHLTLAVATIFGIFLFSLMFYVYVIPFFGRHKTDTSIKTEEFVKTSVNFSEYKRPDLKVLLKGFSYNESNRKKSFNKAKQFLKNKKIEYPQGSNLRRWGGYLTENVVNQEFKDMKIIKTETLNKNKTKVFFEFTVREYITKLSQVLGDGEQSFVKDEYITKYRDIKVKDLFITLEYNNKNKVWEVSNLGNLPTKGYQYTSFWKGNNLWSTNINGSEYKFLERFEIK